MTDTPTSEDASPYVVTPDDEARIAARYPKRRGWRVVVALAVVIALVGSAWLLWTATYHANPALAGQVRGFSIVDDFTVTVQLRVDRPDPSVSGTCHLIAQAVNFQQVGELAVPIPAGSERLTDFQVTIRTFNRATSASLKSCEPA